MAGTRRRKLSADFQAEVAVAAMRGNTSLAEIA